MRKLLIVSAAVLSLAVLSKPASAALITGELDFGSNVGVRVTTTTIDFLATPPVCPLPCVGDPGIPGTAIINSTSNLMNGGVPLDALIEGTIVLEKDLNSVLNPAGALGAQSFSLSFFEQILTAPTINFTLQNLVRCDNNPFVNIAVNCPLGGASPFLFTQTATATTVTINLEGIVFDTTTPLLISRFVGEIHAPFPGQTTANVLSAFAPGGAGFIDSSFSGAKVSIAPAAVPEPATLLTLGTGALFALRKRRRGSKA